MGTHRADHLQMLHPAALDEDCGRIEDLAPHRTARISSSTGSMDFGWLQAALVAVSKLPADEIPSPETSVSDR
jgi:hypothetical protein